MKKVIYLLLIMPFLFAFVINKKPEHSNLLPKQYVKVPKGGVFIKEKKDSCEEFYISSTEVSNAEWQAFLSDLKEQGKIQEYKANLQDTSVWKTIRNEPLSIYYHSHNAYGDYPVVGITVQQAQAYTEWLTERYESKQFGRKVVFSLPTKKQWIRAARGESQQTYPWAGPYLRNPKGRNMANYKIIQNESIYKNPENNKIEISDATNWNSTLLYTTNVKSYEPSAFGLYNMSGNVAELVADDHLALGGSWNDTGGDIRVESQQNARIPAAYIGFRVVASIQ